VDPGDQHWLDALTDEALILSPVHGRAHRVVDFRVDYANAAAGRLGADSRQDAVGSGFLNGYLASDLTPQAAAKLVALFRSALTTGTPGSLDGLISERTIAGRNQRTVRDVRVSKRNDRLLVTFRDVTEQRRSEEEVRRSEERLRALVDRVSDEALVTVDPGGQIVSWNSGAERMYGYRAAEMIGRHYSVLYPRGWLDASRPEQASVMLAGPRQHSETWQLRKHGARFWAEVSFAAMQGTDGELLGFATVTRDLTDLAAHRRRALQLEVIHTLAQCAEIDSAARAILELTTSAIGAVFGEVFIEDTQAVAVTANSRHAFPRETLEALEAAGDCQTISSWDGLAARVRASGALVTVPDLGEIGNPAQASAAAALGLRSAIACPILSESGIVGVLAYFFETFPGTEDGTPELVTEISAEMGHHMTRVRAQSALQEEALRMTELASTDRLTGLKNRREFDRMMGTIPRQPYAILAIDIDHLKRINDEHGHEAGDLVLRTVGTTLSLMLRGWDVVARVGGDEFAAILLDVDAAEAATAAQRLRAAMHLVPGSDDRAAISVGWASAPAGADPLSIWKTADECLYTAKREGRDRAVGGHVDEDGNALSAGPSATAVVSDLVAGQPFHAVYQPIVDLNDGHVIGYEALARPQGFGPSDSVEKIFEVAHHSRQIRDLDWRCRRAALSQAAALPQDVLLFINVSAAVLLDPLHDVDQMLLLLKWTGRSPDHVILEIGEHEHVRDLERLKVVLASYRKAGIRFALDDLGEGFATMELLKVVRAEYIKIARAVTMTSATKESRAAIAAALAFARANGSLVIAEGVENELASDHVRLLGISLGQGFGLGRPSLAADVADTVASWNARDAMRPLRPRRAASRPRMAPSSAVYEAPAEADRTTSAQNGIERVVYAKTARPSSSRPRASSQRAS
jgi:diguanylate cyclase (GGDEF)-like protein/PAS domain S-box-containing protein